MKNNNRFVVLCLGIQVVACQVAFAESVANEAETVIVSATRTAQTVDETLSSVTVITRDDIERQNATSLQEVLRTVAGTSTASNGGEGQLSSLFLRGTNSSHLLVMVDGIKIGSAISGTSALEFIPVEQIERIEIVRGPRSSLYGSEAIGGVIQIFTKKGSDKIRPSLSLSAGSFETYKAVAGVSGQEGKTSYNLSVSNYDTNGFNACNGDPLLGGCFTFEPDDDGYRYTSGSLALGYRVTDKTKLGFNWLGSDGAVDIDGFYNQKKFLQQATGFKVSHDLTSSWFATLQVGQSKDEADFYSGGMFMENTDTRRNTSSLQTDILVNNSGELSIGLDYQDDQIDSNTGYVKTSRSNSGVFTQYIHEAGNQNFQISLRYDDNEQFGNHETGSIAWGYRFTSRQKLILSYGTAFKAPTFLDLYYPGFNNPNLKPEESNSAELGLRNDAAWGSWSINIYQTNIDELIIYNFVSSMPENLEKASIRGAELILLTSLSSWNMQFDLTVIDPENRSDNSNRGKDLPRRPRKTARLLVSRNYKRASIGSTVVAYGDRYDDPANAVKLNSYYTVDLNVGYQAGPDWRISASLKNIFDEDYETAAFYNQPERHFLATATYRPSK